MQTSRDCHQPPVTLPPLASGAQVPKATTSQPRRGRFQVVDVSKLHFDHKMTKVAARRRTSDKEANDANGESETKALPALTQKLMLHSNLADRFGVIKQAEEEAKANKQVQLEHKKTRSRDEAHQRERDSEAHAEALRVLPKLLYVLSETVTKDDTASSSSEADWLSQQLSAIASEAAPPATTSTKLSTLLGRIVADFTQCVTDTAVFRGGFHLPVLPPNAAIPTSVRPQTPERTPLLKAHRKQQSSTHMRRTTSNASAVSNHEDERETPDGRGREGDMHSVEGTSNYASMRKKRLASSTSFVHGGKGNTKRRTGSPILSSSPRGVDVEGRKIGSAICPYSIASLNRSIIIDGGMYTAPTGLSNDVNDPSGSFTLKRPSSPDLLPQPSSPVNALRSGPTVEAEEKATAGGALAILVTSLLRTRKHVKDALNDDGAALPPRGSYEEDPMALVNWLNQLCPLVVAIDPHSARAQQSLVGKSTAGAAPPMLPFLDNLDPKGASATATPTNASKIPLSRAKELLTLKYDPTQYLASACLVGLKKEDEAALTPALSHVLFDCSTSDTFEEGVTAFILVQPTNNWAVSLADYMLLSVTPNTLFWDEEVLPLLRRGVKSHAPGLSHETPQRQVNDLSQPTPNARVYSSVTTRPSPLKGVQSPFARRFRAHLPSCNDNDASLQNQSSVPTSAPLHADGDAYLTRSNLMFGLLIKNLPSYVGHPSMQNCSSVSTAEHVLTSLHILRYANLVETKDAPLPLFGASPTEASFEMVKRVASSSISIDLLRGCLAQANLLSPHRHLQALLGNRGTVAGASFFSRSGLRGNKGTYGRLPVGNGGRVVGLPDDGMGSYVKSFRKKLPKSDSFSPLGLGSHVLTLQDSLSSNHGHTVDDLACFQHSMDLDQLGSLTYNPSFIAPTRTPMEVYRAATAQFQASLPAHFLKPVSSLGMLSRRRVEWKSLSDDTHTALARFFKKHVHPALEAQRSALNEARLKRCWETWIRKFYPTTKAYRHRYVYPIATDKMLAKTTQSTQQDRFRILKVFAERKGWLRFVFSATVSTLNSALTLTTTHDPDPSRRRPCRTARHIGVDASTLPQVEIPLGSKRRLMGGAFAMWSSYLLKARAVSTLTNIAVTAHLRLPGWVALGRRRLAALDSLQTIHAIAEKRLRTRYLGAWMQAFVAKRRLESLNRTPSSERPPQVVVVQSAAFSTETPSSPLQRDPSSSDEDIQIPTRKMPAEFDNFEHVNTPPSYGDSEKAWDDGERDPFPARPDSSQVTFDDPNGSTSVGAITAGPTPLTQSINAVASGPFSSPYESGSAGIATTTPDDAFEPHVSTLVECAVDSAILASFERLVNSASNSQAAGDRLDPVATPKARTQLEEVVVPGEEAPVTTLKPGERTKREIVAPSNRNTPSVTPLIDGDEVPASPRERPTPRLKRRLRSPQPPVYVGGIVADIPALAVDAVTLRKPPNVRRDCKGRANLVVAPSNADNEDIPCREPSPRPRAQSLSRRITPWSDGQLSILGELTLEAPSPVEHAPYGQPTHALLHVQVDEAVSRDEMDFEEQEDWVQMAHAKRLTVNPRARRGTPLEKQARLRFTAVVEANEAIGRRRIQDGRDASATSIVSQVTNILLKPPTMNPTPSVVSTGRGRHNPDATARLMEALLTHITMSTMKRVMKLWWVFVRNNLLRRAAFRQVTAAVYVPSMKSLLHRYHSRWQQTAMRRMYRRKVAEALAQKNATLQQRLIFGKLLAFIMTRFRRARQVMMSQAVHERYCLFSLGVYYDKWYTFLESKLTESVSTSPSSIAQASAFNTDGRQQRVPFRENTAMRSGDLEVSMSDSSPLSPFRNRRSTWERLQSSISSVNALFSARRQQPLEAKETKLNSSAE